eukprot:COSAG01_NODE_23645_length_807_cov_0.927966_1_plen_191_part_01
MLWELLLIILGAVIGIVCFTVFAESRVGRRGYVGIARDDEEDPADQEEEANPLISSPAREESAGEHWRRLVGEVERMRAVGTLDDRQADAAKLRITRLRSGGAAAGAGALPGRRGHQHGQSEQLLVGVGQMLAAGVLDEQQAQAARQRIAHAQGGVASAEVQLGHPAAQETVERASAGASTAAAAAAAVAP